jgi:hypothetical protein
MKNYSLLANLSLSRSAFSSLRFQTQKSCRNPEKHPILSPPPPSPYTARHPQKEAYRRTTTRRLPLDPRLSSPLSLCLAPLKSQSLTTLGFHWITAVSRAGPSLSPPCQLRPSATLCKTPVCNRRGRHVPSARPTRSLPRRTIIPFRATTASRTVRQQLRSA